MIDLSKIEGFEWDAGNARKNEKHGVTAAEAEQAFFNQSLLMLEDVKHSHSEPRLHALGVTHAGRHLHIRSTCGGRQSGSSPRETCTGKRDSFMPRRPKAIPTFRSEAEERRFWETHDSADYLDWSQARRGVLPNLKPSTQTISQRLPKHLLDAIKAAANARDVPYQSLIKVWLQEKVEHWT
jgi:uncharacterized DUF497 family protein/predicted DNA binding CopG/RHH family protein